MDLNDQVHVGIRVSVPFGRNKLLAGIVVDIGETPPKDYTAKYILEVIDGESIIGVEQLKFWKWIAGYYMCSLGQVMSAALPAGLKLEGEATLMLNPDFQVSEEIDATEQDLLNLIEQNGEISIAQAAGLLKIKGIHKYIRSLYSREAIIIKEDLNDKYKSKIESYVSISPKLRTDESMKSIFDELERRAPKQLEVLMNLLSLGDLNSEIKKSELNKKIKSGSAVKSLLNKGILVEEQREVSRLLGAGKTTESTDLSSIQRRAFDEINAHFIEDRPVLLHGVTSSGKTHIYVKLIRDYLNRGQQVLYLLPEIALTSQLIDRLSRYFGNEMVVTHSKFSNNERVEVYRKVSKGESLLVLGTRSAIFQPFTNLGLVIVDEEHETSYKQHEPDPRFHARDTALYLAHQLGSKILLGSATPSFESFYNAQEGKFGLVEMFQRHDDAKMPRMEIIDMKQAKKQKSNKGAFSQLLIDELLRSKKEGKQSILFQNRKGYVPVLECPVCSWAPQCVNCDISLTYYKFQNNLRCHYCGFTKQPVTECLACGHKGLELIGYGTERIEDELSSYAPDLVIQRLDYNTTRRKSSHKKIIDRFASGEIDVLIGTQMITKGLDFDNVRIVGIINADHLLNFPDFRAHERAYQLITQVAGRSGRREEQGIVYIQTSMPEHHILNSIIDQDYTGLFEQEMSERQKFNYPPFQRLVKVTFKHKDALELHKAAHGAKPMLESEFGSSIIGPEKPYIGKIRNYYLMNFLLKLDHSGPIVRREKFKLQNRLDAIVQQQSVKGLRIVVDVDPI